MGGVLVVGTLMIDVVAPWLEDMEPGANYTAPLESCYGGGGGNVAYHIATMGGEAALASGLGGDPLGRAYEERLASLGVKLYLARGERTGVLVALTTGSGERTFIADPGANALVDEDLVGHAIEDYRPRVVVVHGYLLASPRPRKAALHAAKAASRTGSKVVFDPGYYNMSPEELGAAREILRYTDVIVPNEEEARALAGAGDPVEASRQLSEEYGVTVYLKMGARGAALVRDDGLLHVSPPPVRLVNTVGSGDAFTAVVAQGLAVGWKPGVALRRATERATSVAGCACPQCLAGASVNRGVNRVYTGI